MVVRNRRNAVGAGHNLEAERGMSLEEQVGLLSMVDVFEPLSEEELEEIGRRAPDIHMQQGEVFHTPDDRGERLFVLKRGRVQVYEMDDEGHEITLTVAEGGTLLGVIALIGQSLSGVYLRALEESVVCILKREYFEHIVLRNPEASRRLARYLVSRLREAETRFAELAHKEVPARLAGQILRLLESEGVVTAEGYKIPTRYTHEQLATMIGANRAPASRAFTRLKEEGTVELRDRQIHIVDLEALQQVAEAGP